MGNHAAYAKPLWAITPLSLPVAIVLGITPGIRADAIPWSGATTSVKVLDQSSSQSGATAQSSIQRDATISYYSAAYGPETTQAHGSATAIASGTTANLLSTDARFIAPFAAAPSVWGQTVAASASWDGDRIQIQSAPGQALPDTIRVNFSIDYYDVPRREISDPIATITATFNGKSATIGEGDRASSDLSALDSFTETPYNNIFSARQALFHIDLPVNALGLSDPFQVGLKEAALISPSTGNYYFAGLDYGVSLSLTSMTLADGKTPESEGYSVSFASGLQSPNPVPEPGVFAILVVGLGVVAIRRGFWGQSG